MNDLDTGTLLTPYMLAAIELSRLAEKYFPGSWALRIMQFGLRTTMVCIELNVTDTEDDKEGIVGYSLGFTSDGCREEGEFRVQWAIAELEAFINDSAYLLIRSGECRAAREHEL